MMNRTHATILYQNKTKREKNKRLKSHIEVTVTRNLDLFDLIRLLFLTNFQSLYSISCLNIGKKQRQNSAFTRFIK